MHMLLIRNLALASAFWELTAEFTSVCKTEDAQFKL